MQKNAPKLGKVQHQIMQALWEQGEMSARQITERLSEQAPVALSTVQTLLRKMEAKGAVTHDDTERIFLFRPLYQPQEINSTAARDLLTQVFQGSVSGLVAHLLTHETISPEERAHLRELINAADAQDTGDDR